MTTSIHLTRGYIAIVDDCDADLAEMKWSEQGDGYAVRNTRDPHMRLMHRIVLERMIDRPLEKGELCDHIDGNRANNVRSNLRVATGRQNGINKSRNRHAKNPYKGVSRSSKNRWRATVGTEQGAIKLGIFSDPLEAHRAFCIAALKHHAPFHNFGNNSPFLGWTLEMFEAPVTQLALPLRDAA